MSTLLRRLASSSTRAAPSHQSLRPSKFAGSRFGAAPERGRLSGRGKPATANANSTRRQRGDSATRRGFVPVRFSLSKVNSDVELPRWRSKAGSAGSAGKMSSNPALRPNPRTTDTSFAARKSNEPGSPASDKPEDDSELSKVQRSTPASRYSDFSTLGLHPSVLAAIPAILRAESPTATAIQSLAVPSILKNASRGIDTIMAAETGSGKTLAYLLPVLSYLKHQEESEAKFVRRIVRPRAVILVPSRELVEQIKKVAKALSVIVKFRPHAVKRRMRGKDFEYAFERPVDVLIGTPKTTLALFTNGNLTPADLKIVILDEADTLLADEDFLPDVRRLLALGRASAASQTRSAPFSAIVVSATLPKSVSDTIDTLFPKATRCATPNLHKTNLTLKQFFLDIVKQHNGNRDAALLDVLSKSPQEKTLVFCNKRATCEKVHAMLTSKGVGAVALHGSATDEAILQAASISGMTVASSDENDNEKAPLGDAASVTPTVIVCTDYASRGLDTSLIQHVVNYDFPTTIPDYLHRVGRTARAGTNGRATSLIGKKDRRLSERIWQSVRNNDILS